MQNWIPYDLFQENEEWKAKWLFIGNYIFREPFFEETIAHCRQLPVNSSIYKVVTELDFIKIAEENLAMVEPTAFFFHISRCGSTLLAQLLNLKDENIVVSEAPFFDKILRMKYAGKKVGDEQRMGYFKNAVRIYGQKRFGNQNRYFIKLDSWHIFFLEDIRKAFPDVPFIFLKRNLPDIIKSHRKLPGMQSVPGLLELAIYGYTSEDLLKIPYHKYLENILEKMVQQIAIFTKKEKDCLLVDYEDGTLSNFQKTLDFLNIKYSSQELLAAKNRLKFHSKKPMEKFQPAG